MPPDLGTYQEARTSAEDEDRFLPAGPTAANAHATRETSAKSNLVRLQRTASAKCASAAASVTYICRSLVSTAPAFLSTPKALVTASRLDPTMLASSLWV